MPTPDGVPCRHCGTPISWDETCWTHDLTGFADCGAIIGGNVENFGNFLVISDPEIVVDPEFKGKYAEPMGDWD
jgi:hypothetical protein